jgi:hypothetical protein
MPNISVQCGGPICTGHSILTSGTTIRPKHYAPTTQWYSTIFQRNIQISCVAAESKSPQRQTTLHNRSWHVENYSLLRGFKAPESTIFLDLKYTLYNLISSDSKPILMTCMYGLAQHNLTVYIRINYVIF